MKKTKKEKDFRLDTILTHISADPGAHHGAVNVPAYRMSTVVFDSYEDYKKNKYGLSGYGRMGTPTSAAFEQGIAALERADNSVATCSGLAAVATTFMACTAAGDHIVLPDNGYGPGRRVAEKVLRRYGVEVTYYPPLIGKDIRKYFQPNTKLVHLEAPGSFTYEVSDIGEIVKAAQKDGIRTSFDNSWAAGIYFNPLEMGIDISVMSATKYISGHSDAMLGVISARGKTFEGLKEQAVFNGICAGADELYLGLRGLRTLHVRMERHQKSALAVAKWLSQHAAVQRVLHPALPSCPGHDHWKKYFSGASGTFGIILKETRLDRFGLLLDDMKIFRTGFSWGGFESLLFPEQPGAIRTAEPWTEKGLSLRLHIGLENVEDLQEDLEEGFKRLKKG